jgi:hypothetical protein
LKATAGRFSAPGAGWPHYQYRRTTIVVASIKIDKFNINDTKHCTITTRRIFLLVIWTRGA